MAQLDPEREALILELESKGALPSDWAAVVEELRGHGAFPDALPVKSTEPSILSTIGESLISKPVIGATAAAIGGGFIGGPPGAVIGGISGFAAGRAAEAAEEGASFQGVLGAGAVGAVEGTVAELLGGPLSSVVGAGFRVGKTVVKGGVGTATSGMGFLRRTTAEFLAEKARGTAIPKARRILAFAKRKGQQVLPGQISESRLIDTLTEATKSGFLGGAAFSKAGTQIERVNLSIARHLAQGFIRVGDPRAFGQALGDTITTGEKLFQSTARQLYGLVDKTIKQVKSRQVTKNVTTSILKESGKPFTRSVTETVTEGIVPTASVKAYADTEFAKRVLNVLPSTKTGQSLLGQVRGLPDNITFDQLFILRSDVLKALRSTPKNRDNIDRLSVLGALSKQLTNSMKVAAIESGPDAQKALSVANAFYRQGVQPFNRKFIKALRDVIGEQPERVVDTILQTGRPSALLDLKEILVGQVSQITGFLGQGRKALDQVRREVVRQILDKSAQGGRFGGERVLTEMENLGTPILKKLLGLGLNKELRSFGLLLKAQQEVVRTPGQFSIILRQPEAVEKVVEQTGSGLMLSTAFKPGLAARSAAILLGPHVLSHVFTDPRLVRILNEAIVTPVRTTKGRRIASVLTLHIRKIAARIGVETIGGTLTTRQPVGVAP